MAKINKIKKQTTEGVKKKNIAPVSELKIDGYDIFKDGITQSLITSYMRCPRLFLYKVNRWKVEGINWTTNFGSLVHDILDRIYRGDYREALKEYSWVAIIEQMIEDYEKENEDDFVGCDLQEWEEEKAICLVVLSEYVKFYPEDFTKKNFVDVEKEICETFFGVPIKMKLDGRYLTKTNKNWLMEHKTKGRISEDSIMKILSFDFQNLTYVNVTEQHYNLPVDGVLYNLIRKPGIRKRKAEQLSDYAIRLREDIQKRPEYYFIRYEVPYTKRDKTSFMIDFKAVLNTIIEHIQSGKDFWRVPANCQFPYPCKFLDACASGKLTGYCQEDKLFPELKTL